MTDAAADRLPIRLPPIVPREWRSKRAGFQWLVPDGGRCAAHQIIAHCVFGFSPPALDSSHAARLNQEEGSFRIALVARHAGIVHHARSSSNGGWHDMLALVDHIPGTIAGVLAPFAPVAEGDTGGACLTQIVVGRKATPLSEDQSSLHSGWHDRRRTWMLDHGPPRTTVLGLGICELTGVMLGADNSFGELLTMLDRPVQLVNVPDIPLVHTAGIVTQQLGRSETERNAIWADFCAGMAARKPLSQPDDWIFGSSLIKAICASPAGEDYTTFSDQGIGALPPADVVIMSLHAESPIRLRHRRLGYDIRLHRFRFLQMGPALRSWLKDNFVQTTRSIEDIRTDYLALIESLKQGPQRRRLMLLNMLSSLPGENIQCYQPYDEPGRLTTVWAKMMNLMAEDLARDHGVTVIDADAIGVDLGIGFSASDGIHQSGEMQTALRAEIVRCLDRTAPV
ncbi:MAG: hypothetical protein V4618_12125 [Pseudomonadota bacterium]